MVTSQLFVYGEAGNGEEKEIPSEAKSCLAALFAAIIVLLPQPQTVFVPIPCPGGRAL